MNQLEAIRVAIENISGGGSGVTKEYVDNVVAVKEDIVPEMLMPTSGDTLQPGIYYIHGYLTGTESFSTVSSAGVIAGEFTASADFTVADVFSNVISIVGVRTVTAGTSYQYSIVRSVMIVINY